MAWPKKKGQKTRGIRKSRKSRVGKYGPKLQKRGPELKSVDVTVAGPTATIAASDATVQNQNLTTGYLICNLVQQGDSNQTRDGELITGKHLGLRFEVQVGGNAETSDALVRWLVVLDKNPNGSNPTLATVLRSYTEDGSTATTFNSGINPQGRNRFMIMAQNTVCVSKVSGPAPLVPVSVSLPLFGLQTRYAGSANPMTNSYIYNNAIYFICFGQMTGAGTLPTIRNFYTRYTFAEK